jgi:hypothetical protein
VRLLLHVLVLLLGALPVLAASDAELETFARSHGLKDVGGFVETVRVIETTGRLPSRYLSKDRAEQLGWRPGRDLCEFAPGGAIGGDRFGNRERRLPEAQGRRWTEADLDYICGRRGPKRLVFSSDRLIYITVDHYERFHQVPR